MASPSAAKYHPLQRLASPSRQVSVAVHILGLLSFAASFSYLVFGPRSLFHDSYGWHWQLLTIIGLTVAALTFLTGLLADVTLDPRLFAVKNVLALCSAPLEVLISLLYWGISAIDKTLVVPPEIHLDWRADVGFHLMPALLLTLDLLLLSPPWSITAWPAMALSTSIAFGYWAWVEHCFQHNGWYPYPLFSVLTTPQRALLFIGAASMMAGSTLLLKWLYATVNGIETLETKNTPAKIKGEKAL